MARADLPVFFYLLGSLKACSGVTCHDRGQHSQFLRCFRVIFVIWFTLEYFFWMKLGENILVFIFVIYVRRERQRGIYLVCQNVENTFFLRH